MRYLRFLISFSLSASSSTFAQQTSEPQLGPLQRLDGPQVVLPPDQIEERRKNRESLRNSGEVQMLDDPRRTNEALPMVQDSNGRGTGFKELDKAGYGVFADASINPAVLDESYLSPDSRSYVDSAGSEILQLHTDTKYGTVLIEEFIDTVSYGGAEPNTLIDGKPANIVHIEYSDGWATAVYVQHGTSFFVVESDRRISDGSIPDYLEMVEKLVLSAQGKRTASVE